MAKIISSCMLVFTLLYSVCAYSIIRTTPHRDSLAKIYRSYIGTVEATGKNDGKQVNEFQAATGNRTGDAWCASFAAFCLKLLGIKITGNGMAASWFGKDVTVWSRDKNGIGTFNQMAAVRGNTGGLYFPKLKRIAHIFFIDDLKGDKVITVEGNTNNQLSREGNGCFQCIRKIKQIYKVSDYVR